MGSAILLASRTQLAVDVDSRLIVGERVSPAPNDKQQLVATLDAIAPVAGPVAAVLADSGFYSEEAVQTIERTPAGDASGTIVYAAMEKISHHRSVADLEKMEDPAAPPPDATVAEQMRHRLKTSAGRKLYKLRQQTVEPVIGIVKAGLGFRQFLLRGQAKVATEWTLVCLAYSAVQQNAGCTRSNSPQKRPPPPERGLNAAV